MKKWTLLVCMVGLVLALVGCAPSQAPVETSPVEPAASVEVEPEAEEETPEPLEIVESGYIVDGDGPYVLYGLTIKNPNEATGADYPSFRITMRDKNGDVVGTDEQTLNRIYPDGAVAWGGLSDPNGQKPAKVEFEIIDPGDNWKSADTFEPADFEDFTIDRLKANKDDWSTYFTGELVNPNATAFDQVAITILLRDASGKIVTGYSGFADKVGANSKVPFEVSSMGEVPKYKKIEAYAQPW